MDNLNLHELRFLATYYNIPNRQNLDKIDLLFLIEKYFTQHNIQYDKLDGIDKIGIFLVDPTIKIKPDLKSELKKLSADLLNKIKGKEIKNDFSLYNILSDIFKNNQIIEKSGLMSIYIDESPILINYNAIYKVLGDQYNNTVKKSIVKSIQNVLRQLIEDISLLSKGDIGIKEFTMLMESDMGWKTIIDAIRK